MKTKRIIQLDIIKIICTVIILFHHFQQITEVRFPYINFCGDTFYFGYIVEFFFLISGYVTYPYIKQINEGLSFRNFFLKKYLRFLPRLVIGALVFSVLEYFYYQIYGDVFLFTDLTLWNICVASLGLQSWWGFVNPYINNPTWYISSLLLCYVVFYFLTYISHKKNYNNKYLYIVFVFLGIGLLNYGSSVLHINTETARAFYSFFTGLLLSILFNNVEQKPETIRRNVWLSVFVVILLIALMATGKYFIMSNVNYVLTFILYPLIMYISIFGFKVDKDIKTINILSKASFGAYIIHVPLLVLMLIVSDELLLPGFYAMILFTILSLIIGYIFEVICEKLFDSRLKQLFK